MKELMHPNQREMGRIFINTFIFFDQKPSPSSNPNFPYDPRPVINSNSDIRADGLPLTVSHIRKENDGWVEMVELRVLPTNAFSIPVKINPDDGVEGLPADLNAILFCGVTQLETNGPWVHIAFLGGFDSPSSEKPLTLYAPQELNEVGPYVSFLPPTAPPTESLATLPEKVGNFPRNTQVIVRVYGQRPDELPTGKPAIDTRNQLTAKVNNALIEFLTTQDPNSLENFSRFLNEALIYKLCVEKNLPPSITLSNLSGIPWGAVRFIYTR